MKYLFALLMTFGLVFSAAAQVKDEAAATAPVGAVLTVEVEGGKTLALGAKELAKFARRDVRARAHDEKDALYAGYDLGEILRAAGARLGRDELKGKELAAYLVVEAADGYRATFAVAELSADFTDRIILLADARDGKPLDAKAGPWQIVVPDDKKHGRWVRQVTALKLKKAQ